MAEVMIDLAGKQYPIVFSTNAAYALDLQLRSLKLGTVGEFVDRTLAGRASLAEIQLLLWACLEGGRKKAKTRTMPFTVDEVGDMIDDAGGVNQVVDHLTAVLLGSVPKQETEGESEKGDPSKKEQPGSGIGSSSSS